MQPNQFQEKGASFLVIVNGFLLLFALAFPLCAASQSNASESGVFDEIYLSDGTMLRGIVQRYDESTFLELLLPGGSPSVFVPAHLVRRVNRQTGIGYLNSKKALPPLDRGLYQICSAGLMGGTTSWYGDLIVGPALDYSAGFFLDRHFALGLGFGVHMYNTSAGETVYPLFLETRGILTQTKPALYYAAAFGYGFAFADEINLIVSAEGGPMIHPSLGLNFGGKDYHFHVDFGLRLQNATWERNLTSVQGSTDIRRQSMRYMRFVLRLGLMLQ